MVSLTQVAASTVIGGVLSFVLIELYRRWARVTPMNRGDAVLVAVVVGVSILLWREAGNTPPLNDDPIPLVSPNDVLCPAVTYVSLGLLADFRPALTGADWPRLRALLTLLSLVVNVVTI